MNSEFVEVAVEAPLPQTLTYRVPENMGVPPAGTQVQVPLGRRKAQGVVLRAAIPAQIEKLEQTTKIKSLDSVIESSIQLGPKTLVWLEWLAHYYQHPPGQVFSLAFSRQGEHRKRASKKKPLIQNLEATENALKPNASQQAAIDKISQAARDQRFETFLLFGVTGSGKTEVYLQSIQATLETGKQVLVLVPEISLTPQLLNRFTKRFGNRVALIHSDLTDRERADQWWSAVKGQKDILVGARSALFCPLENLGLIVVDEEHESSFKQEEMLKYNARDAAIMRAKFASCPIVLGSATPSLESWKNVLEKKYSLLELPKRIEDRPLPQVHIVDLRVEQAKHKEDVQRKKGASPAAREEQKLKEKDFVFWLTPQLEKALRTTLERHEQAALFLNRRGFASLVICPGCGTNQQCPNCSVTLTLHARSKTLLCHYCDFKKPLPPVCTSCGEFELKPIGLGTQRVAEDLQKMFPLARIARADRDEISSREDLENLIAQIESGEIDILVGTQMIAKGHDFPNITLVGVVMADIGLHMPDFRSSERTFQLLTQVAGRAGRHQKPGEVIIQTLVPEHPAIQCAVDHDFVRFANLELVARKELLYPPFGRLACIRLQGSVEPRVLRMAETFRARAERLKEVQAEYTNIEILGPTEAPLAKLRGKFRFQILIKSESSTRLATFIQKLTHQDDWLEAGVKLSVDIDPINLM